MSLAHPAHPHHLTVQEYLAWGESAGIDQRTELLEGEICEMSPESLDQGSVLGRLHWELLKHGVPIDRICLGGTLQIPPSNAPVPDMSIMCRRPRGRYLVPQDLALVVEVALSTIVRDRLMKAPLYAKAGIPEYWIVDVEQRAVIQHRGPRPDGMWESMHVVPADSTVGSTINGLAVDLPVAALFAGLSPEEPG